MFIFLLTQTAPSLECPFGVEQFEPKAVDPVTMLADSNLLNHYLAQCLRCELKVRNALLTTFDKTECVELQRRTREIQRQQQQQQRDTVEQGSSDVIISNPNGSFAFALKDGCNSRLIWPADCLCLVCPAANAQHFTLRIDDAQEKNPQVSLTIISILFIFANVINFHVKGHQTSCKKHPDIQT